MATMNSVILVHTLVNRICIMLIPLLAKWPRPEIKQISVPWPLDSPVQFSSTSITSPKLLLVLKMVVSLTQWLLMHASTSVSKSYHRIPVTEWTTCHKARRKMAVIFPVGGSWMGVFSGAVDAGAARDISRSHPAQHKPEPAIGRLLPANYSPAAATFSTPENLTVPVYRCLNLGCC